MFNLIVKLIPFYKCVLEISISKAIGPSNILVINAWIDYIIYRYYVDIRLYVSWRSFGISVTRY